MQFFKILLTASVIQLISPRCCKSGCICTSSVMSRISKAISNGVTAALIKSSIWYGICCNCTVPASSFANRSSAYTIQSIRPVSFIRSCTYCRRFFSERCSSCNKFNSKEMEVNGVFIWWEISAIESAKNTFSFWRIDCCSNIRCTILSILVANTANSPSQQCSMICSSSPCKIRSICSAREAILRYLTTL